MKPTRNTRLASILVPAGLAVVLAAACSDDVANGADAWRGEPVTATPAATERREVIFAVPDMSCPMCPITVRKALAGVDGVLEADASLEDKQARVVFDPARTGIDALVAAIAEAGFRATPQENGNG